MRCRLPSYQPGADLPLPRRSWWAGVLAALAFIAALAGWLVLVRDIPPRTAFIYFADAYPAPFSPPGWIDEDRDRFTSLDGLTLQVESAGFGSSLSGSSWDGLEAAIRATTAQIARSGVLIVDVRGLGAVGPQRQPALIPPTADSLDPGTWIPVDELCRQIQMRATKARQILLVLDCLPTRARWVAGCLENDFPASLADWAARSEVRREFSRFTILCRDGAGESRWRSRRERGSILQMVLWDGLAGAADEAGDADRRVELSELLEHVQRTLPGRDRTAVHHLGSADLDLAHALPAVQQRELKQGHVGRLERSPEVTLAELQSAWRHYEQLMQGSDWQQDLPAIGRLLRALAWWEENLWSGRAGEAESLATNREVSRWVSYLSRPPNSSSLPPGGYPLLALQHHTGASEEALSAAEARSRALTLAGNRAAFVESLDAAVKDELLGPTVLRQMASLMADSAPDSSWRQPQLIQQMLRQRARFEAVAASEDVRASRQMTLQLQQLRAMNLAVFDALQVGSREQLSTAADTLNRADRLAEGIAAESSEVHRILRLCDRVRLELPFLAEWAVSRDMATRDVRNCHVNGVVLPLILAVNDLDAALHPESAAGENVAALAAEVERHWLSLRGLFESEWERLLSTREPTEDDFDQLELLLKAPLLTRTDDAESRGPAEQRIELLKKLYSTSPVSGQDDSPARVVHERRGSDMPWSDHPALVLLGAAIGSPKNSGGSLVEDLNDEFRRRLRSIEQGNEDSSSATASGRLVSERLLQSRRGLALARRSTNHWAIEYRCVAWADLLLWLAEGALTEFWGPPPEGGEPLMARHVAHLLSVASGLAPSRQQRIDAVRTRLAECLAAAQSGLSIDAESLTPLTPQDRLSTRVVVRAMSAAAAFPEGQARLSVLPLGSNSPEEATVCSMSSLSQGRTQQAEIRLAPSLVESSFADAAAPLLAEAWFRGHRFSSSFRIIPAGGRIAEVDVDPTAATTFLVESRELKSAAITFILDCSASMQDPLPREGGELSQTRKLTAAVTALHGLLTELTDQPGFNVGVMFYGHRATHDPKSQNTLLQRRYAAQFAVPEGLRPFADVESILTPGRFGAAELGAVAARLERLLPWGETPLYLAVVQAADQLERLPFDAQRHIVVVTDGRNYQFNPPPDQRVDFNDALDAARRAQATVHVIGLAMPTEERDAAIEEFESLANRTGGVAHLDVSLASDLVHTLRTLIGPASFTWKAPDETPRQAAVNSPVVWEGRCPTKVSVTYGSAAADIELRGGEAVRLLGDNANASAATLESAAYLAFDPQFVPLQGGVPAGPTRLVGIHQPCRQGTGALFEFSLKRDDGLFLKRPAVYAVSIQPVDAAGAALGAPYQYRGGEFAPRLPVPAVRIRAIDWPAHAVQADVRFSAADEPSANREVISLPSAAQDAASIPLRSTRGVEYVIRQTAEFVQCVLRHRSDSPGLGRMTVSWCDGPPLAGVRRRIDVDARMEVHTFLYARPETPDATATLQIIPPGSSELTMSQPVRVRLAREPDVITPAVPDQRAAAGPAILR